MRLQMGADYQDDDLVVAQRNGEPVSPSAIIEAFAVLTA